MLRLRREEGAWICVFSSVLRLILQWRVYISYKGQAAELWGKII